MLSPTVALVELLPIWKIADPACPFAPTTPTSWGDGPLLAGGAGAGAGRGVGAGLAAGRLGLTGTWMAGWEGGTAGGS